MGPGKTEGPDSIRWDGFQGSEDIKCYEDLFRAENLLNDNTQKVLLPYIRKTKTLFENVIREQGAGAAVAGKKITDALRNSVTVFPSLDLGFPNNLQRLAGGFATGMLILWNCKIPIVPIDATVNVCSSSVFELPYFNTEMEDKAFNDYMEDLIFEAVVGKGYPCRFDSGNHFLMIAQDLKTKHFSLVLHSSVNEYKDSHMGLYPVENNWYGSCIRTNPGPNAPERYIRYIKGDKAACFIEHAHKMEGYNIQIHQWFADAIGKGKVSVAGKTFHHYYMPTDQSIAIGTFAEEPGTVVPVFSNIGKDITMFRIGRENWKIKLGGRDVCLVPHGWGQTIDQVSTIRVDYQNKKIKIDEMEYTIRSEARMKKEGRKHIRDFTDGQAFFEKGKSMIKGEIVRTLRPIYLYCSKKKGKVNKPL